MKPSLSHPALVLSACLLPNLLICKTANSPEVPAAISAEVTPKLKPYAPEFQKFSEIFKKTAEVTYELQKTILRSEPEQASELLAKRDQVICDAFQALLKITGDKQAETFLATPSTFKKAIAKFNAFAKRKGYNLIEGKIDSAIMEGHPVPFYSMALISPQDRPAIQVPATDINIPGLISGKRSQNVYYYQVVIPHFTFTDPRIGAKNNAPTNLSFPAHGMTLAKERLAVVIDDPAAFDKFRQNQLSDTWNTYTSQTYPEFIYQVAVNEATSLALTQSPTNNKETNVNGKTYTHLQKEEFLADYNSFKKSPKAELTRLFKTHSQSRNWRTPDGSYQLSHDIFEEACKVFLTEAAQANSQFLIDLNEIRQAQNKHLVSNGPRIIAQFAKGGVIPGVELILQTELKFSKTNSADRFVEIFGQQLEIAIAQIQQRLQAQNTNH